MSLYVANRGKPVSLRMLSEDGTPLTRRYFCPVDERELSGDEIVRGYEIDKDQFIVIEDEELESLAPEKSQEIDLNRFVPVEEIEPVYFERAYFLLPDKGAPKAYRLLATAMEEEGKAGLATFVMRGKEYLVAIIAENGILRAETMRFADELRSPDDVGLPEPGEAGADRIQAMEQAIGELSAEELDRGELVDRQSRRLLELARRKLERGEGVLEAPEEIDYEEEGDQVVDLMRLLKESLREVEPGEEERPAGKGGGRAGSRSGRQGGRGGRQGGRSGSQEAGSELRERSKAELYEQARELDIPGRSGMNKDQLIEAIRGPRRSQAG